MLSIPNAHVPESFVSSSIRTVFGARRDDGTAAVLSVKFLDLTGGSYLGEHGMLQEAAYRMIFKCNVECAPTMMRKHRQD